MATFNPRALARVVSLLSLAIAASGSAQSSPLMRFAALTAEPKVEQPAPVPAPFENGPFGLSISTDNTFAARWEKLQPMLRIETKIIDMCRSHPEGCPAAAAKFISIVDEARMLDGRARAGVINRAMNMAIRPVSDRTHYGVQELWASPLTTMASGAGDCEDYAIAKYMALREAGVATADLRLVVVKIDSGDLHAIVATRVDGEWLILDNRNLKLLTDADAAMTPLAALGEPPALPPAVVAIPSLDDFSV